MTTVKCLIVDDEELARELIINHISKLQNFTVVASCASAIEANDALKKYSIDLIFLDIEMPVLKGTDFYRNLAQKPKVIFTTAYRDYALDGFDVDAVDYLLKPIVFARFFQAIRKFQDFHLAQIQDERHVREYLFVRKDRKQVKIVMRDILYVQGLKDYIKIYMVSGSHIVKHSLGTFEKELDNDFIRIHRSYIINQKRVTAFSKHDVEIDDIEIPIGEQYRENLETIFSAVSSTKVKPG